VTGSEHGRLEQGARSRAQFFFLARSRPGVRLSAPGWLLSASLEETMGSRVWRTTSGFLGASLLLAGLTACGDSGDLTFTNEGSGTVTVSTDDQTFTLSPANGTSILDNGCNKGDVTVTFESGSEITLAGPVCPDKQVVIGEDTVAQKPL
jgi:hypothetical protein